MRKAKEMNSVGKLKVIKVVRVGEQRDGCKGVIAGVPLSVNMKQLVDNLKVRNRAVRSAKRMTRGVEKKETETVLVEFEARAIPSELYFGFVRYRVREYMPKPMRCFKCQGFGHIANVCKRKTRCARCGGEHEYGKCGEGVRVKCCNCGGNHSAAYWGCEVMRREVEVQQIRRKEKITYAEAVRIAGQEKQSKDAGYNKEQMAAEEKLDKEDMDREE